MLDIGNFREYTAPYLHDGSRSEVFVIDVRLNLRNNCIRDVVTVVLKQNLKKLARILKITDMSWDSAIKLPLRIYSRNSGLTMKNLGITRNLEFGNLSINFHQAYFFGHFLSRHVSSFPNQLIEDTRLREGNAAMDSYETIPPPLTCSNVRPASQ